MNSLSHSLSRLKPTDIIVWKPWVLFRGLVLLAMGFKPLVERNVKRQHHYYRPLVWNWDWLMDLLHRRLHLQFHLGFLKKLRFEWLLSSFRTFSVAESYSCIFAFVPHQYFGQFLIAYRRLRVSRLQGKFATHGKSRVSDGELKTVRTIAHVKLNIFLI